MISINFEYPIQNLNGISYHSILKFDPIMGQEINEFVITILSNRNYPQLAVAQNLVDISSKFTCLAPVNRFLVEIRRHF